MFRMHNHRDLFFENPTWSCQHQRQLYRVIVELGYISVSIFHLCPPAHVFVASSRVFGGRMRQAVRYLLTVLLSRALLTIRSAAQYTLHHTVGLYLSAGLFPGNRLECVAHGAHCRTIDLEVSQLSWDSRSVYCNTVQ